MAPPATPPFWLLVTRLGEAQLLLPALAVVCAWLALRSQAAPTVLRWVGALGLAAALTTVTKVAFFGYGIGHAPTDFTGISGHAMSASAVLPMLAFAMTSARTPRWRQAAMGAAVLLALVVGVSRAMVGAHSASEVVAGLALGGFTSALVLWRSEWPVRPVPKALLLLVAAWLVATPAHAPVSPTHGWVIELSLAVSGRSTPYTRQMLQRDHALATSSPPSSTTVSPR